MFLGLTVIKNLRFQRYFKISFFYIIALFVSFIFWLLVTTNFDFVFLSAQGLNSLTLALIALLFFSFSLAVFASSVSLIQEPHLILGLILLMNLPYFFMFGFNILSLVGFLVLFLCFYFWAKRIQHYEKFHSIRNPLKSGLSGIRLTIITLLAILAFSFYIDVTRQGQVGYFLDRLEKYSVQIANSGLKFFLPRYQPEMSSEQFFRLLLNNKFFAKFFFQNSSNQPSQAQIALLEVNLGKKFRKDFQAASAQDVVSAFVHEYLTVTLMRYHRLFPEAVALAFFLFLRLFYWIYYFFFRLFLWLWMYLLLKLKIVRQVVREVSLKELVLTASPRTNSSN